MKTQKWIKFSKILALFVIGVLTAFSCEEEQDTKELPCVTGDVLGNLECCEGSLIQIKNSPELGGELVYKDVTYENVIQSPGLLPDGEIYFNYREYDMQNDSLLFLDEQIHNGLFGLYDVPIIVITDFSQTNCPE